MHDQNSTVAIVGVGFISPQGTGLKGFSQHFRDEQQQEAKNYIEELDPHNYLGKNGLKFVGASSIMFCNLAYQGLENAGLLPQLAQHRSRIGIYDGSELANLEEAFQFDLSAKVNGADHVSPMRAPNTLANASASYFAIREEIVGPNVSVCGGSNGFVQALHLAKLHLDNGMIDFAVVCATDHLTYYYDVIVQNLVQNDQPTPALQSHGVSVILTSARQANIHQLNILAHIHDLQATQGIEEVDNELLMAALLEELPRKDNWEKIYLAGLGAQLEHTLEKALEIPIACENVASQFGTSDSTAGGIAILTAIREAGLSLNKNPLKTSYSVAIGVTDPISYMMVIDLEIKCKNLSA
jgi:3-oxoacyl-[acyl-carrier-protein] synthase II